MREKGENKIIDKLFPGNSFTERIRNEYLSFFFAGDHRKEFFIMAAYATLLFLFVIYQEFQHAFDTESYIINSVFMLLGVYFLFSDLLKRKKVLHGSEQFFVDSFFYVSFMGALIMVTGGTNSPIAFPLVFLMAISSPIYGSAMETAIFLFSVLSVYVIFILSSFDSLTNMQIYAKFFEAASLLVAAVILKIKIVSFQTKEAQFQELHRKQELLYEELQEYNDKLQETVSQKTKELDDKLKKVIDNNRLLADSKKAVINILEDVKLEKRKTERISQEMEKFRLAVENASDHIVITDSMGIILYMNKAAERITGFTIEEVIGKKAGSKKTWGGLMEVDFYRNLWETIKTKKENFSGEITNKRKDGNKYIATASIFPILGIKKDVRFFVAIEKDITRKKKQEEAMSKLAAIVQGSNDAIVGEDLQGKVTSWNKGAKNLYGYDEAEMLGKSVTILLPKEKKDDKKFILDEIKKGKDVQNMQTVRQRKDGSLVEVAITASPLRNAEGEIVGASLIVRDITKEKQIDRAKTEFVSLASHQLRTPLTAIKWNAELLLNGDAGEVAAEQREYMEEIFSSNERMIDLVNGILNVSRLELGTFAVEPEPTNIVDVCESVLAELRPSIMLKKLVVKEKYSKNIPVISADPRLLRIVIQNLLSNATKYTPDGGMISLEIVKKEKDMHVSISDTGFGIPEKQQKMIFTKLFRADNARENVSEGTGLGLYVVKAVVEQFGGKIWFESKENKGTTFYVTIPLEGMKKKEGTKELTPTK